MKKQQEQKQTFAMEILSEIKRRLIICRIALAISLAGDVLLAAALIFR